MTETEAAAWFSFVADVKGFLELVVIMLNKKVQSLGTRIGIKISYPISHLDRFPENLGDVSEEQGERFHQDIKTL